MGIKGHSVQMTLHLVCTCTGNHCVPNAQEDVSAHIIGLATRSYFCVTGWQQNAMNILHFKWYNWGMWHFDMEFVGLPVNIYYFQLWFGTFIGSQCYNKKWNYPTEFILVHIIWLKITSRFNLVPLWFYTTTTDHSHYYITT